MIKNIRKDRTSTSYASYGFFLENYDDFKPIKKITVFFDSNNFLITPYKVDDTYVHMVLENWNEQQLHINNMNCGYGGEGPSTTAKLLKYVGVDEEYAEKLKFYDGFQINFDENGKFIKSDILNDVFFGDRRRGIYEFYLDDYTYIDLNSRKVYLINPQIANFLGLLKLIDKMKPNELEYYIGENSPLENGFRFEEDFKVFKDKCFKYNRDIIRGVKDVNLIIRGELFDVICLVNKNDLMVLINSIYMYIFKRNLFENRVLGNYITAVSVEKFKISSIVIYYLKKLINKNENYIHEVIKFEGLNKERREWKYRF